VIPLAVSLLFDEFIVFEKNPITALAYTIIDAALVLLFNYFLLKMFLKHICPISELNVIAEGKSDVAHV
jgi:hypothetical protein